MNELLKKVQKTEYDILKELNRICKKHNISYFLGQGTLLGAAKYQGFIPWDDDIDLLIPYDELDRLLEVFPQEASREYMISNHAVERYFPLPWTKIRAVNTLSRPKRYKNIPINWGICIDLFPVYPLSNSKILRRLEVLNLRIANKLIMAEFTKYEEHHTFLVRLLEKVPICVRHGWLHFAVRLLRLHQADSEYVLVTCKGMKVIKRSILFGEEKSLAFEGDVYPVPAEYNTYLTLNYGDYMAPLPKEEQKGHELNMGEIEWRV